MAGRSPRGLGQAGRRAARLRSPRGHHAGGRRRLDAGYPRDTWLLRRLGTGHDTAVVDFTGISQPWLRELAKRWTRWRITVGRAQVTYSAGVRAVTRLSAFLESTGAGSPALLTRDVLE